LNPLFLTLVGFAQAGVPVVWDTGTSTEVLSFVAQRTGLPPDQLEPRPLDGLLQQPATTLGLGALRHCATTPTQVPQIRAFLVRAEAAWRSGDAPGAMDQADLAVAGLGCLKERAEIPVATRIFLLRGGLLAYIGQTDIAREEMRTALSLQADAVWDAALPPQGAALLDEVRPEVQAHALALAPHTTTGGPWVDGRDPAADGSPWVLRPGLHLVQVPSTAGITSSWLTLNGDTLLVVPSAYRRPVLGRLAVPTDRTDIERLLQATLGNEGIYVANGGGLWLVGVEDGVPVTTTLVEPPPPPAPVEERKKKRR